MSEDAAPIRLEATPPPSPWPRRLRRLGVWGLALLMLLAVCLPWLLSTGLGNRAVLRAINGQIPGTFTAQRVRIGWFGGAGLTGGELRDEAGALVLGGLDVSAGALGIVDVWRGSGFGDVVVTLRELVVEQGVAGPTNLERALGLVPASADAGGVVAEPGSGEGVVLPMDLGVSLKLTADRVSYTTIAADGSRELTVLSVLDASADLSSAERITATLTGRLERDGASGVIDADVSLLGAVDAEGRLDWRRGGVELAAEVLELPLGPVDRLLGMGGLLPATLGERLEGSVSASGTLAAPEATVAFRSALMSLEATLVREGEAVRIEPGAALAWRLTPEGFAHLSGTSARGEAGVGDEAPAVTLLEAVDVRVPIELLSLPLSLPGGEASGGVALERASGRAVATWSPVRLGLADGREVSVREGVLRVDTAALSEGVSAVLGADASVRQADGRVREDRLLATLRVGGLVSVPPNVTEASATSAEGVWMDVALERFPVALGEALAAVNVPGGGLTAWLGPEMSLDAEVRMPESSASPWRVSGLVRSAGVTGRFEVTARGDGSSGSVSTPEALVLRLDPAVLRDAVGAEAWFALPVGLRETIEPSVMVRDVRWSLRPVSVASGSSSESASAWMALAARVDPEATYGQIEWAVPSIKLTDHGRDLPLPELRELRASVSVTTLSRPVEAVVGVSFDGPKLADQPRVADGGVTLRVTGTDLLDRNGVFTPQGGTYDALLRGTAMSAEVVDAFAGQGGKLAATLGPSIEPEVTAKFRPGRDATMEIDITSTHAVGSLLLAEDLADAVWKPVLQEDPRFTLAVSEPAVASWMGRLHPIFADVVRSAPDAPARLTLDRNTFALSEQGFFDLDGIRAEAILDLGKLELRRQGWLRQGLTGIVRQFLPDFQKDQAGQTYLAAFSPMRLSIEHGIINTSELWLAADDMGVGFAGSIDLKTNRIDMGLGVLGATFIAAGSDFEKALEPLRVYELPIRGTLDQPSIQVDKFLGQVAAAYGQRELERNAEKLGGWGKIIGVIGGTVVEDALQWRNSRAWAPSDAAQAFAVTIADPQPAEPAGAAPPAQQNQRETPAQPAESEEPRPQPEDDVQRALRGILDIIGEQRKR